MGWINRRAEGAGGRVAHFLEGVDAALRTAGNPAQAIELHIGRKVFGEIDGGAIG